MVGNADSKWAEEPGKREQGLTLPSGLQILLKN
jgi:hypothetical protein